VVLTGDAGAGKSVLAALVYRRLEAAAQDRVPLAGNLRQAIGLGMKRISGPSKLARI
jgi:adenylylsulfate kinase-like enzyme